VYDDKTEHKNYLLPHPDNYLEDDSERLRDVITAIDGDIHQLDAGVEKLDEDIGKLEETAQNIETALGSKAD
jgi:prefoldin subunit 5